MVSSFQCFYTPQSLSYMRNDKSVPGYTLNTQIFSMPGTSHNIGLYNLNEEKNKHAVSDKQI